MSEEEVPSRRFVSAAEKRAIRRARVLKESESRLKLLKGQIPTLKMPNNELNATSLSTQVNKGVDELLTHNLVLETPSPQTEFAISQRVNPAQRRRDAAARRRKKEKKVQEMLDKMEEVAAVATPHETADLGPQEVPPAAFSISTVLESTFSRHLMVLMFRLLEEKLVLLLIVAAAGCIAAWMDLSFLTAGLVAEDQLFATYQDLIAKGIPTDFIRQQFEREQTLPEMREKLELLLTKQLKMETAGVSSTISRSGWLPNLADVWQSYSSLVVYPPVVFCVFIVRLLVSTGVKSAQKALDLPDVNEAKEGDLGFVANLALSSHPVLKEFLVKGRKSLDDVFVFIFALVVLVAIRVIWLSR